MVKLCLMASHGYPLGLGIGLHQEQVFRRASKDFHHLLPCHWSSQDLVNPQSINNLNLKKIDDREPSGRFFDGDNFLKIDSTSNKPPAIIDVQESLSDSVFFSLGIAEQCIRQEILKLLASRSIEVHDALPYLSMIRNMMKSSQQQMSDSRLCNTEIDDDDDHLIFPTAQSYTNDPCLDLSVDQGTCDAGIEMHDVPSIISDMFLLKNTTKSAQQTMLVPYFERRRRAQSNINALHLATESLKTNEKVKERTSQTKKKMSTRTSKDRDIYGNSGLHACESLLSLIVGRNHQQNKNVIHSLKKSGPQLPQLLTQFSASIAGTGIAVIASVILRVVCSKLPFSGPKLLSTGLGLGLVWLSSAVNKLRDTVVSINRCSGKRAEEKEKEMMNNLDQNLKDIYFRMAALMVVAVLRLA